MSDLFDQIANELSDGDSVVSDNESLQAEILSPVRQSSNYQDDLQAEFARLRRGAEAAGRNGSRDEFYQQLETQLDRMRQLNAEAAGVGNPKSAADKALGGNATLTSAVVIRQASVLRWEGIDEENKPVTVTLCPVTPLAAGGTLVVRPFAYIKWGTYGNIFLAEVDIGWGRQFTINASFVEVVVALDALTAANAAQANLAASMSFGTCVRTSALIRTRYIDSATQNTPQTVVIPPFATGLLPVQMSDLSGSVQLDFYDSSNVIRYSLTVANGTQAGSIALTGDITKLVVTSTTGTTQHIRLPFELSI